MGEVIGLASDNAALNRSQRWRILVMIAIIPSGQIAMNTVVHVRSEELDGSGAWGGVEIGDVDSVSMNEGGASTMFSEFEDVRTGASGRSVGSSVSNVVAGAFSGVWSVAVTNGIGSLMSAAVDSGMFSGG